MQHGLVLANIGSYADPRVVARVAAAAEEAGWDALFVWDHLGFVWDGPAGDPWILLAAAATATERILLGTAVTPLPRRRPHVVAHQLATLDALAPGRMVFGAGLGGNAGELRRFGDEVDERVRAEMLDEALDVVRALLGGGEVDHRGAHYVVDGVTLRPVPSRLPIWIGGNSPRALRRAARFDGWLANTVDIERMTLSPEEVAARRTTLPAAPFDVVVMGYSEPGDEALRAAYAEAGATWWLESFHDRRGDLDGTFARVAAIS
jgi:alkanesulfonate monooxygenase SsuD/methylene tetrahydromethanopterin reductase-like flavin-dependent oxidoreductase (luciferase family)